MSHPFDSITITQFLVAYPYHHLLQRVEESIEGGPSLQREKLTAQRLKLSAGEAIAFMMHLIHCGDMRCPCKEAWPTPGYIDACNLRMHAYLDAPSAQRGTDDTFFATGELNGPRTRLHPIDLDVKDLIKDIDNLSIHAVPKPAPKKKQKKRGAR
jgi:hypothetical protein